MGHPQRWCVQHWWIKQGWASPRANDDIVGSLSTMREYPVWFVLVAAVRDRVKILSS
jgi:hypothetical protein